MDRHWRNLWKLIAWSMVVSLFNILTTCVHCFVIFYKKRSIVCITTQQEFSEVCRLSNPRKKNPSPKETLHGKGWFILSLTMWPNFAQHHSFPHSQSNEFSRTNTPWNILCIVYIFYSLSTIWKFHSVIFCPSIVLRYEILEGEIFQSIMVLVNIFLHPLPLFGVCSHFSAFRLNSCKRKTFRQLFSLKQFYLTFSVLWKLKRKTKEEQKVLAIVTFFARKRKSFYPETFFGTRRRTIVCVCLLVTWICQEDLT